MKRVTNIMQKQLLLTIMVLSSIVAYGDIPSNLPGRLWAQVGTRYTYSYSPNTPILIEDVSSGIKHRVIVIEAHRIENEDTFGYKFRSKDGTERLVVESGTLAQYDTPQDPHMFICYDNDIPDIIVYKFLGNGKIGDYPIAEFNNLHIGYNNFYQETDKKRHIVVLPMLDKVSSTLYKVFDIDNKS